MKVTCVRGEDTEAIYVNGKLIFVTSDVPTAFQVIHAIKPYVEMDNISELEEAIASEDWLERRGFNMPEYLKYVVLDSGETYEEAHAKN
jgi:hypothetical protein